MYKEYIKSLYKRFNFYKPFTISMKFSITYFRSSAVIFVFK